MKITEVTCGEYIAVAQWAVDKGYASSDGDYIYDKLDGSTVILLNHIGTSRNIDFRNGKFTCEDPDLPVLTANWYGAAAFCDWLSLIEGLPRAYDHSTWECNSGNPYSAIGYRMPTEAEWEYACRAGSSTAFSNGPITYPEDCPPAVPVDPVLNQIGWYCGNASSSQHVALKTANAWGLRDMHGNTEEWCNDRYGVYGSNPVTDPTGSSSGGARILRGGAVTSNNGAKWCRSASRGFAPPDIFAGWLGIRPVKSIQ